MIPSAENSRRIGILNQSEINNLYQIPKFTDDERSWFFELNGKEQKLLEFSGNTKTKADVILQFGYFKAKNQFFQYRYDDVQADINYILTQYFDSAYIGKFSISREIKRKNQKRILNFLGYKYFRKTKHEDFLLAKSPRTKSSIRMSSIYFP